MIGTVWESILRYAVISVASVALGYVGYLFYTLSAQPLRDDFPYKTIDIDHPLFIANDLSGYENRPDITFDKISKGIVQGQPVIVRTPIRHDADGGRVPVMGDTGSTAAKSVVAVGGSQTWGQGVAAEQTFPTVFASLLGLPVRNYGVSGSGGASSYFLLKQKLAKTSPKYVLYGFWEDHLNRNLRYCANNNFPVCAPLAYVSGTRDSEFKLNPAENAQALLEDFQALVRDMQQPPTIFGLANEVYWAHRRLMRQLDMAMNPLAYDSASVPHKIDAARFVLASISALAHEAGAQLIVLYIPLYFSDTIHSADPALIKTAEEHDFLFVDMAEVLRDMRANSIPFSIKGDGHLTVEAHMAIARRLRARIAEN